MKLLITIFLLIINQVIFCQSKKTSSYNYKTPKGKIVTIEIDTTKYKPNGSKDFLYKLYNDEIDASIFVNEKIMKPNDTINKFEKAKKEFEFTDLGVVNGEKTITLKSIRKENDITYVNFLYIKFLLPNEVLNFTVTIPENYFEAHKKEFIRSAKSMKLN